MPSKHLRRHVALILLAHAGLIAPAGAQIVVRGQVDAYAATANPSSPITQNQLIGDAYNGQPGSTFEQNATVTAQFDFAPGDLTNRQTSQATAYAYASYGGLRASVSASSQVGNHLTNVTGASGRIEEAWNDVVTFHTSNPLGSDFIFSMTLDDSLSTLLYPSYVRNSDSSALAIAYFYFGSGAPLLSVIDNASLYIPDAPVTPDTRPTTALNSPGARTVSAVMHVFDGQVASIAQTLLIQAGVEANGLASSDAADTAYFNLYSSDPMASYAAASGTVYATSGDPFLPVAAVPEPSEWALMLAGFGAMGVLLRRGKYAQSHGLCQRHRTSPTQPRQTGGSA